MIITDKYRPKNYETLIGRQSEICRILLEKEDNEPILLHGSSGIGKTTIAKIVAESKNGHVVEMNISADNGIDVIRGLIENINTPSFFPNRIFILNEIHGLTNKAQNALLDPLEFLPSDVYIIATTTEMGKLSDALLSRFSRHYLQIPSAKEQFRLLKAISKRESFKLSEDQYKSLIKNADGNIRDLLKLFSNLKSGLSIDVSKDKVSEKFISILYSNSSIQEIFNTKVDKYTGMSVWLCKDAIYRLRKEDSNLAREILKVYGNGFVENETEFYSKLLIAIDNSQKVD